MHFPEDLPLTFAARAAVVSLRAEDVTENFILGSGRGGQRRNKRATAVQLIHHPTGIEVKCSRKREQHQNRIEAWTILLERMEDWRRGVEQAFKQEEHTELAQKRKRSYGGKQKVLREKKRRSEIKVQRKPSRP